jgi:hypothetical protein
MYNQSTRDVESRDWPKTLGARCLGKKASCLTRRLRTTQLMLRAPENGCTTHASVYALLYCWQPCYCLQCTGTSCAVHRLSALQEILVEPQISSPCSHDTPLNAVPCLLYPNTPAYFHCPIMLGARNFPHLTVGYPKMCFCGFPQCL